MSELNLPPKAKREFEKGVQRLYKQDPEGGLQHFVAAIGIAPEFYQAYYDKGIAESQLDRNQDALDSFQKSLELSEGHFAPAEFGYGLILCRLGKPAEAEKVVRHGLQTAPNTSDGHVILGLALLGQQRLDEAERSLESALALHDAGAIKALLVAADIHAARGDFEAEGRDLDTYLAANPKDIKTGLLKNARQRAKEMATRKLSLVSQSAQ